MATGRFRLKTNNDWNTIFYRFKQGKQFDIEISTGIQIPNNRWSDKKQTILATIDVDYKGLNEKLKELDLFVQTEFNNNVLTENLINSKWLKEKISICFNRETKDNEIDNKLFLSNYITSFIEESKTKKTKKNTLIKHRTIQHYNTTLNKIYAFESHIGKRIKFTDVTLKFHTQFVSFLEKEEQLNPNTIGGYVDDLKLFLSSASKNGFKLPNDYKFNDFYSPTNKTKDIYLRENEINLIYNVVLEHDYLDNARDWFIIGLRTGLRISDFLNLTTHKIIDGFIEKETIKTEYPVIIPIHHQVESILAKRNGNFPRQISDQRFNDYIKIICKIAGLDEVVEGAKMMPLEVIENGKTKIIHRKKTGKYPTYELVSSHICRRSFATNLYGQIDTLTIMKITGHQTESQFLKYIKITPREYANRLKDFWKNTKTN